MSLHHGLTDLRNKHFAENITIPDNLPSQLEILPMA